MKLKTIKQRCYVSTGILEIEYRDPTAAVERGQPEFLTERKKFDFLTLEKLLEILNGYRNYVWVTVYHGQGCQQSFCIYPKGKVRRLKEMRNEQGISCTFGSRNMENSPWMIYLPDYDGETVMSNILKFNPNKDVVLQKVP